MSTTRLFSFPFVLCSLANFAQGLCFNLFLHFPRFLEGLGAGKVMVGWVVGSAALSAVLVRPPLGWWMDTRGRRGAIWVGNAANLLAMSLYFSIDGLGPWLFAVRILHGLAEATLFTVLFTYAADCVPASRRTEGLALFGVSGMLPIGLGPLIGDWILGRFDFVACFAVAWLFAFACALLSLPLRDQHRRSSGTAESSHSSRGFRGPLLQADLLPLWWVGGIFALAVSSAFTFIRLFVDDTGLGSVGGFFSAYAGTAVALRVFLGWVPDRVGPKRVLLPSLAALAAGFAVLSGASNDATVWLAGALIGMGHGYAFPVLFSMVVTRARDSERGSAMAIYTALFDVGTVFGGPGFGILYEWGGYPGMFGSAVASTLLGCAIFGIWDRGNR